jgi:hypothetical protein
MRARSFPRGLALALCCLGLLGSGCGDSSSADEASETEESGSTESDGDGDGDGDTSGDGDGDGDTSGDGDGDPSTCPEPFVSEDPNGQLPPPFVDCTLPEPCELVNVDLDASGTTGGDPDILDPAALGCVLASLDARSPALHEFEITSYNSSETIVLRIYADGHAELSRDQVWDSSWYRERSPHHLDPEADFAGCEGELWANVWPCIRGGLLDCESWGSDAELCPG